MFPLLLCETWEDIYRVWKERKAQPGGGFSSAAATATAAAANEENDSNGPVMWIKSFNQLDVHSGIAALTCQCRILDS